MRTDQALLQPGALIRCDVPVGQRAEPGRDPVDRGLRRGQVVDVLARADDRLAGLGPDPHPGAVAGDPYHVVGTQRPDVNDHLHDSI
jgi:hypothetical protein